MSGNIKIKQYDDNRDDKAVFALMRLEADWGGYCDSVNVENYKIALKESLTYVLYNDNILCGFIRVRDDFGFAVYIHDLLVGKMYRGNSYGKMLIEHVADNFLNSTVYVMSDVDDYYHKQGYKTIEGRIIIVREKSSC
ncbi:MAG: GNAT family N-acetyltransferase [Erysipelotrichales bacterium]|nr:GNAT family N-acetyltransferase [Erysipelotrichales bacterium]